VAVSVEGMEELTQQIRQHGEQLRALVHELRERAGWSATLSEATALTQVLMEVRQVAEAGYLRAVKVQDERERAVCPAGRGRNSTADSLVIRYRLDRAQAVRDVTAARALDATSGELPTFAHALLDAQITREHVDAALRIVDALQPSIRDRVVEDDVDGDGDGVVADGPDRAAGPRTVVQGG